MGNELKRVEVNEEQLIDFLVDAKKQGYASGAEPEILKDGSKQFTYQRKNFYYTDNYIGGYQVHGKETVKWEKTKIFSQTFIGGLVIPK